MVARVESAIQSAVIHFVRENYPAIIITATANERSFKETEQIGSIGIPDLILFDSTGRVLFLELKRKKGKLRETQVDWNIRFDAWHPPNYSRAVAYGYNEAIAIISAFLIESK